MDRAVAGAALGHRSTPLDYLVVTTAIYAAGFGLVTLGHWLRARRTGRVTGVDLEQARS